LPQGEPEAAIPTVQGRSWPFPFEDGELLPKREDLERGIYVRAEEDAECGQESKE
jgi:hypothetical protein